MKLKVIIQPGEDRGFIAEVPAFRGCRSQGRTRDEALTNVREAIEAWLEVEQDMNDSGAVSGQIEMVTV